MKYKLLKSFGFTLAEVLITLGVIGIVASLTIPTLMAKQRDAATVAAVKKSYSILSQAYTMAAQENGSPKNWDLSHDPRDVLKPLVPFLKVIKDCSDGSPGCWVDDNYSTLSGFTGWNIDSNPATGRVALADGSLLATSNSWNPNCDGVYGSSDALKTVCGVFYIDTNGLKKPNKQGVDLFYFYLTDKGILPMGGPQELIHNPFSVNCRNDSSYSGIDNGGACTAWVVFNGNLDYQYCPGDLAWSGKHACR